MKEINWSEEKNDALKENASRGHISFEHCRDAILSGNILDILENTKLGREHQKIFVLNIQGYAYAVPYVENEHEVFLKTLYPSRAYTAKYFSN